MEDGSSNTYREVMEMLNDATVKLEAPPGDYEELIVKKVIPAKIEVMSYSPSELKEEKLKSIDDIMQYLSKDRITWVNVIGLNDIKTMEAIVSNFSIHPLAIEDIMNLSQRPIIEDYESYLQIVSKCCNYDEDKKEIIIEQVSLLVGPNYVISFQEKENRLFNNIKKRIKTGKGRIRRLGSDYLAYVILDCVVDHYFVLLQKIGEDIEETEDKVMEKAQPDSARDIFKLKRELIYLRKSVWPLRDIINSLNKTDTRLFKKGTSVFLRDLYDHTVQVMDTIETYRDLVSTMIELHHSSLSNKMNEIIKVLTIVSTIFAPLTFIVGVYGMNMDIPEFKWKGSYLVLWGVMLFIASFMVLFFKKRKWF